MYAQSMFSEGDGDRSGKAMISSETHKHIVFAPDKDDVRRAIDRMDNDRNSIVTLCRDIPPQDRYLAMTGVNLHFGGGGPRELYIIQVTDYELGVTSYFSNPNSTQTEAVEICFGQGEIVRPDEVFNKQEVLKIAFHFLETGIYRDEYPVDDVRWSDYSST